MKRIAIFWHAVFYKSATESYPMAIPILWEQWEHIRQSGLCDQAEHIHIGVNGGPESVPAVQVIFPNRAVVQYHGVDSKAENLTIVACHEWCKQNPGWSVLYFHGKGATHWPGTHYGENVAGPWRRAMMKYLVGGWRDCVKDLETHDISCARWMWEMADGTQHIPAGNGLWVTSDFVASLPSMYERDRIKQSGIAALESRYEAEVFWGNGRRPVVKSYLPNGGEGIP